MMTKEGSTKIVSFMTPGAGILVIGCGHLSHIVKMHYFLKNILLYYQAYIRQTNYIVLINKDGSTKIVTFMTPGHSHQHGGPVQTRLVSVQLD